MSLFEGLIQRFNFIEKKGLSIDDRSTIERVSINLLSWWHITHLSLQSHILTWF